MITSLRLDVRYFSVGDLSDYIIASAMAERFKEVDLLAMEDW